MNELCADIGYLSVNHVGEQLCGDHVEISSRNGDCVAVLSDGLGSGVKANILSILTSKILSTMLINGMPLNECVSAVASTLPVCSERQVAYSTFTAARIIGSTQLELTQYDNPRAIFLRDGKAIDYPQTSVTIDGKTVSLSRLPLKLGDILIMLCDGVTGAGPGLIYNHSWELPQITDFIEAVYHPDYTAKELCTLLLDHCMELCEAAPSDDMTVCVIKLRRRTQVNLIIGPPAKAEDDERVMSIFFSKQGRHIVCGGTTAVIAARFLKKAVLPSGEAVEEGVPPTSEIDGVDLVTEGVVTMARVLKYVKDYAADNASYSRWSTKNDGASLITRMLLEEATDITLFAGSAQNEGNAAAGLSFDAKAHLVDELDEALTGMGKNVKLIRF